MSSLGFRLRRRALAVIGGTAATALLAAGPAHAEFGLTSFSASIHDPQGNPVTQAGSHADLTIEFDLAEHDLGGQQVPDQQLRNVVAELPPGMYGNPRNAAACEPIRMNGPFPSCPIEAQVGVAWVKIGPGPATPFDNAIPFPIYNVTPKPDEAAVLAFSVLGAVTKLTNTVRPDGGYRLRTTISNVNQGSSIYGTRMVLWGVPADPAHDAERGDLFAGTYGSPSPAPRTPFMTAPMTCGQPLEVDFRVTSWQGSSDQATDTIGPMTGCAQLPFDTSFSMLADSSQADAPSGYTADLRIAQNQDPDGLSAAPLRNAVVQLPEGTAISPSAASGLSACTDGELGVRSASEPSCPVASKIGTVEIITPLLGQPLSGEIFLGSPQTGAMFRVFLVARGSGIILKIPGTIAADPRTGRLTATFTDAPELPFDALKLRFSGGDRAALVNPPTCGYKAGAASLASYGGQTASLPFGFTIDRWDGPGMACPETAPFAPVFQAGTTTATPSADSAFVLSVRRPDRHKTIDRLNVDMPSGLLGQVSKVPLCGEAEAAAGTCAADHRVGSVGIEAGAGGAPFPLTGDVFLAGPYKGAPFSLSIVVNAIAGPFDLGKVVVRAPIRVDAANAKLAIESDSIPNMLAGIPLRIRTINITIDRPGFMHTPANCAPMEVKTTVFATDGTQADVSTPYAADGCAALPFSPKVSFGTTGNGGKAGSNLAVRIEQGLGEGHLKSLKVVLPDVLSARLSTAAQACPPEVFDRNPAECPALSLVGTTSATTPALPDVLSGPVHLTLVEGGGLPNLVLTLEGQGAADGIDLRLVGKVTFEAGRTTATFDGIPDVPLSSFTLDLAGGADSALQGRNVCKGSPMVDITAVGHHGAVHTGPVALTRTGCPERSAASKAKKAKKSKKAKGKRTGKGKRKATSAGRSDRRG